MFIKLKPVCMNRIWGGRNLEMFDYTLPPGNVGEAWCVSGHDAGSTSIVGGQYDGKTLSEVYRQQRHLFADDPHDTFPLLVKILDAQDDLSIQIHPGDAYAQQHARSYGKTECWYVLGAKPDSQLIIGHHGDQAAVAEAMKTKQWNDVLYRHSIQSGDFFFVPSGTIHAIGKGSMIYEVQQSSDITYRLYDYDRLENGALRELHEQQALDVLEPFDVAKSKTQQVLFKDATWEHEQLVDCQYFKVNHYIFRQLKQITITNDTYLLCGILQGSFIIDGELFQQGDHFICTSLIAEMEVEGVGELFVTSAKF